MAIKVTMKETVNTKLVNHLLFAIKELKELEGVIGILAKDGGKKKKLPPPKKIKGKKTKKRKPSKATVLDVAIAHEFGAPDNNLPERSFLRAGVKAGQEDIQRVIKDLVGDLIDGKLTGEQVLGQAAEIAKGHVIAQFESEGNPGWDAIERNGKILQLTGQLMQSIHTQVRAK